MELIAYHSENRIATITLNRPEKRNALNFQVVAELKEAFQRAANDTAVKVVILKATGKVFCAGADLGYLQELQRNTYEENLADSNNLKALLLKIYAHPKVVIAQVHGHAIAGGCGLVSVCDFIFTVPEAGFGYTEVKIGFVPAIVMPFLIRRIGEGRAKALLLTGEWITAERAFDIGLVNKVVDAKELEKAVQDFALTMCKSNSGQSMAMTKEMIAVIQGMNLEEGTAYAAMMNAKARNTEDCQRGIAAFLNKETLDW